ncbi:MAG: hypothetical protein ACR2OY_05975 [Boseongicola sp.]
MDPIILALVALVYVSLQGATLARFSGPWRIAAIVPVPALCAMLIVSVVGGLFGIVGSEIASIIAVPVGLIYLIALIAVSQVARLFRPRLG